MLPDGRRLGAHLATADGMVNAADRAAQIGATAIQIFSDNPTAWERRSAASPEIPAFAAALDAAGIAPLAIHGSYLINLAGDDDTFHAGSVALLAAELETARWFGAALINIHIGSHRGSGVDAGVGRLVDGLLLAFDTEPAASLDDRLPQPVVTLENSAGGGGGLGVDVAELATIAAAADRAGIPRERVGFCLDTAHLWGAGYDIADPAVVDRLIRRFADTIGIDRLPLIHLNDTRAELGSRVDRHQHLGAGGIGRDGLAAFLRHPLLRDSAFVIETPGMEDGYDAINLRRAVAIAAGSEPEPLPEGALTLPGSRSRAAMRRSSDEADPAQRTQTSDAAVGPSARSRRRRDRTAQSASSIRTPDPT